MTTFTDFAAQHGFQPYELAAYLDLGTDYDETEVLTDAQVADYTEIIAHNEGDAPQDEISAAVRLVSTAETTLADARAIRDQAIRDAIATGESVTKIAERAGMTRGMIYTIAQGKTRRE